eukprot:m.12699 g.12699  ORF g.12699 m.12699 type:complete len:519 (+) comp24237_c0_seq1:24-1580(+)
MSSNVRRKAAAKKGKKKRGKAKGRRELVEGSSDQTAMAGRSSDEEYESTEDEQEDPEDYCRGGYHPVSIGDLYNDGYSVIRKLGWGHFSTVWLSWDVREKRYGALKVVKSASHYSESAQDEIKILKEVRERDPHCIGHRYVIQLYDRFRVHGIHGTHHAMVFEVLGHNLLKLIAKSDYMGVPLVAVKRILKQVLFGLDYLHMKCQIIHTDIKPENVLVCLSEDAIKRLASSEVTSKSAVSNIPSQLKGRLQVSASQKKLSKNKKKKMKKKAKLKQLREDKENERDEQQQQQQQSVVEEQKTDEDNEAETPSSPDISGVDPSLPADDPNAIADPDPVSDFLSPDWDPSLFPIDIKIADLGNACWVDHHFTEHIQTRQYRAPEVLLGSGYGPPADVWSVACMAFELATGEYLFEPHSGDNYSRDEDHLAHIIELLGNMPRSFAVSGKYCREFFTKRGDLKNIEDLRFWDLKSVLVDKYQWNVEGTASFADFLLPMLECVPIKRIPAGDAVLSPYLNEIVL